MSVCSSNKTLPEYTGWYDYGSLFIGETLDSLLIQAQFVETEDYIEPDSVIASLTGRIYKDTIILDITLLSDGVVKIGGLSGDETESLRAQTYDLNVTYYLPQERIRTYIKGQLRALERGA